MSEDRPTPESAASTSRRPLLVAGIVAAALIVLFRTFPVNDALLAFVTWVRGAGAVGWAAFVAAYVAACVLFLPGALLTLGAGFAYGLTLGVPLVWLSANLGAVVAFVLGRTLLRDTIAARVAGNPKFAAIDRAVGREGLKVVLLTRLSPAFPFNLLNYAYGLTGVTLRDYVIGSLVGMLPGTILFVYLGSLVTSVSELGAGKASGGTAQYALYVIGLVATVLVTVIVTRVARRALAEATAERSAGPAPTAAPSLDGHLGTIRPDDTHNRTLLSHVHPPGRVNPTPSGRYNLVVIGGGTAGLVSAAGGAGLGAKVALIERHLLGGDCLNVGCVPSKGLIGAARIAQAARRASTFGVQTGPVTVDFPQVMERMRQLRAGIAPNDGVERFTSLGVDVFFGSARFTSPTTVEVDGRTLEFSRAVIATGARAAAPPIPGLEDAGYLTNETVFELTTLPARLVVIGAGPIGCEMAQTFRAFGSAVTMLHTDAHVLPREDADAAAVVERQLAADGVTVVAGVTITRVERTGNEIRVHYRTGEGDHTVTADQILVGVGRAPNVDGLGLDAAGIAYERRGVTVNDYLQTTNPRVYAAGDVASRWQFTHTADALARIVLTNALFLGRKKASALTVPWCTYTTPEVAHVGLSARDAATQGIAIDTITIPLHDVDRAILEGETEGFFRAHVKRGTDQLVGATLVAPRAGDMISEVSVAMAAGAGLGTIANVIHPYPTQAEIIKRAGDAWNRTRLTPTVKSLFRWWLARRR